MKGIKKYRIVIIITLVLLLSSLTVNFIYHYNANKLEFALNEAVINNNIRNFDISSLATYLKSDITEEKLFIGQEKPVINYYPREFQNLNDIHRELVLLYSVLISDEKVSGIVNNSLFYLLENFASFFNYLYDQPHMTEVDSRKHYIVLDETFLEGIKIISNIIDELSIIKDEVYKNKTINNKDAWKTLMVRNEEYINSSVVKLEIQKFQQLMKSVMSK